VAESGISHVVALADTHLRRGSARSLPESALAHLARADAILHAGDLVDPHLLDELAAYAPVIAVLGNNDHAMVGALPDSVELTIDGVRIGMVHDSGPRAGRPARMRRRFPDADVVVFGHSHEPLCQIGVDGQLLFNPGSPTQRRRAPAHTLGLLELRDGSVVDAAIVPLDPANREP
jgi:putative phosphoesterase